MSFVYTIDVRCDLCFTELDEAQWTTKDARVAAEQSGWIVQHNGRAICEDCQGVAL